jgi:Uncharacterized protein conserved in bacteria
MFYYDCGSRGHRVARELLGGYRCSAQSDGYEAICFIRKLYAVEADANKKGLAADERKAQRLKISYPVIQLFEKWMTDTYVKVLPKSRIGEAIAYTYSLLPRLSRYVNDGHINIDNNLIENAIRPLALGRKNWLFCGNNASAHRAAIVYSLIGTCKAAGVDPIEWMEDVLCKLPYYHRYGKDLSELLPRTLSTRASPDAYNPLASDGVYRFNADNTMTRQPWFGCACCPSNLCRFIPSIPSYMYAVRNNRLYVNLFGANTSEIEVAGGKVQLQETTQYPWNGDVSIRINRTSTKNFAMMVRVPGWVRGQVVPGDLYSYSDNHQLNYVIKANSKVAADGTVSSASQKLTLIPYYAWNHKGAGKMEVWIPQGLSALDE